MRALFQSTVGKSIAALCAALFMLWPHAASAAYPERPITLIVPWGAGGGTDAVARILGTLLEKDLGQPVNVVNRTGGSGVVGHQAIAAAPPDGYTIGMITVEIGDDALARVSPTSRRFVHADRAGQCRPGGRAGARRRAVQEPRTTCSPRSRPTRASSKRRAPARAASGTWRSPAC